jgi:WD40 repeat protein
VSADGGRPRQLTTEDSDEVRPSWSQDGHWIYFGSNRTGAWQVYKPNVESDKTVQLTRNGGREAFESADGNFVYYSKREGGSGACRQVGRGNTNPRRNSRLDPCATGHLLRQAAARRGDLLLRFLHSQLDTGRPVEKNKVRSVEVSSEGRRLLYTQPDDSDIMLLDNGG